MQMFFRRSKDNRWRSTAALSLALSVAATSVAAEMVEWSANGGYQEQMYSDLAEINESNVEQLGFAWEADVRTVRGRVDRGMQATPIMAGGTLFTSGPWGAVYAIDAATGNKLWQYEPELDGAWARKTCCDAVNRGVALHDGVVYVGQLDGFLIALDADTGDVLWKVDTLTDRSKSYTLTGAPQIAGEVVVIGNGGAEFGVRGYITAYDLDTGAQRWRFFTVPGDPADGFEHPELELAATTWASDTRWEAGGGGTVWDSMVYDPTLDLLYVGVGNGSPHPVWLRSADNTDNLFLSSILAIDPNSGRLSWHYQTTPGDSWDYTATQPMVLAELEIDGVQRPVLMQAPKNGFFYVLDRRTGELISAEKYVTVTWADHVDIDTGRPLKTAQGDYSQEPKLIYPSPLGGHNWMPMSYNRNTGLVYLPAIDMATVYSSRDNWEPHPTSGNWGSEYVPAFTLPDKLFERLVQDQPEPRYEEYLLAWDPVRQREAWRIRNETLWNGGTLSTAGNLVFQGTSTGHLYIYRASDGKRLKTIYLGTAILAAPMSYAIDGEQYVAVMAGYGGVMLSRFMPDIAPYRRSNRGRLIAFKLDGAETPVAEKLAEPPLHDLPPRPNSTEAQLAAGKTLFADNCNRCHGGGLGGLRSGYPDLFNMPLGMHQLFREIVLDGILSYGGMAGFKDVMDETDLEALHAYLIDTAYRVRAGEEVAPLSRAH